MSDFILPDDDLLLEDEVLLDSIDESFLEDEDDENQPDFNPEEWS